MKTLAEHYADFDTSDYWQDSTVETLSRALERWYEERRECSAFMSSTDEMMLDSLWRQQT
jgi:hypothetical protein